MYTINIKGKPNPKDPSMVKIVINFPAYTLLVSSLCDA